jgi:hypothetical protein
VTVVSGANGSTFLHLPLPNDPGLIGFTGHSQFAFLDACAPGGLTSSCALSLTIQ